MQPLQGRWLIFLIVLFSLSFVHAQHKSLADLKIAADAGDPVAQTELADRVGALSPESEVLLRMAAAQNYAPAQGKLGNRILNRSRMQFGKTPEECAALGKEALMWCMRAAMQGDKKGQAGLASIYLEGKWIHRDFVQAYKWGDLAAQAGSTEVAGVLGQSCRHDATLKMTREQIEEARKLVAEFKPVGPEFFDLPPPPLYSDLKLKGISGSGNRRLAMINNQTFASGDQLPVKVGDKKVNVRCVEIHERSVIVAIEGESGQKELSLDIKPTSGNPQ
jgi:hypothetical protein